MIFCKAWLRFVGLSLAWISLSSSGMANTKVQGAVVTRSEGEAELMIRKSGSEAPPQGAKSILFEKETYFVRPVRTGDRPSNGDVITTGKTGKVRLIFRNGDQVTVTPGTAFKFTWDAKTDKSAVAELVYGDIRAVIQPEGPRSGLKVKTKSAVMGVRGTDFYVSAWSKDSGSKVAVVRGSVAVASLPKNLTGDAKTDEAQVRKVEEQLLASKAVTVNAGSTGTVQQTVSTEKDSSKDVAPVVVTKPTTQQELVVIQSDSKVQKPKLEADASKQDAVTKEIVNLEQASVNTTLVDIKKHDPELHQKILEEQKKAPVADVDQVQSETIKKAFTTAPSEEKAVRKPTLEDLDSGGGDIYEKYKWQRH